MLLTVQPGSEAELGAEYLPIRVSEEAERSYLPEHGCGSWLTRWIELLIVSFL